MDAGAPASWRGRIGARLVPLDRETIAPGSDGWAQLVLDRPIAAAVGDRFVLRDTSAQRTLGGGRFVDLRAPTRRRRTPARLAQLAAIDGANPVAALLDLTAPTISISTRFGATALCRPTTSTRYGSRRVAQPTPCRAGSGLRFKQSLHTALAAFHVAHPAADGAPPDTLRRAVEPRLPAHLFTAALGELARQNIIAVAGGSARLPDHAARLAPAQQALWQKIQPLLSDADRFQPPRLADLAESVGTAESDTRKFMKQLAGLGLIEEVAPDHFFLRAALSRRRTSWRRWDNRRMASSARRSYATGSTPAAKRQSNCSNISTAAA